jgi:GNAT superfamily N-acetyltransferase
LPKPINLHVQTLAGAAITPYLPEIARLRITVFRDWPYIYQGDAQYEENYLRVYVNAPRAAAVLAFDGARVIGASTCLPLHDETASITRPFLEHGLEVEKYFYFGESLLEQTYRGQGIGVKFFEAREAHARSWGDYSHAAFCAVQRPDHHPLRPADYVPLDEFWARRGYTRQPRLNCLMSWLDVNETAESEKTLTFWTKAL